MLTAFLLQQCLHERASLLRYTHIACLVSLKALLRNAGAYREFWRLWPYGIHFARSRAKVKQCHYRPWQTLRVPGGWGSQILRQLAHEDGTFVSPTHWPPLTLGNIYLLLVSVRGWVDPRTIMRPRGLCQRNIPMTPSGIDPATIRFVAQCLTHCATASPTLCRAVFPNLCKTAAR
jgi:hypothetical protein